MASLLTKQVFTASDLGLPEVQQFHCGDEPWDREVADWIKSASGENSVIEDMKRFGTEVWLHRDEQGVLVGYSSLGETKYTWPIGTKKKEVVSLIAFIGVHEQFKGMPKDAERDDKYAYQILDELLAYAAEKTLSGQRYSLVVLSVDERNTRAIRFYEYREFFDLKIPRLDKEKNITYKRMARHLDDLIEQLRSDDGNA